MDYLTPYFSTEVLAFFQVVIIDLVLSADNGLVVGLAAAGLSQDQRKKAILFGIILATLFRVLFAVFTVQMLKIPGLLLIGGLLLFWVGYKMWKDIKGVSAPHATHKPGKTVERKQRFSQALTQIVIADISMSLDNVLAVAGAAREHPNIMMLGLGLSIVLMATVATAISNLLKKYPIIGTIGLLVIIYIAAKLTYQGGLDLLNYINY